MNLKSLLEWPELIRRDLNSLSLQLAELRGRVENIGSRRPPEPPPHFVLVLLQGRLLQGQLFSGAMSGRMYNGTRMTLRYDVKQHLSQLTALVICDLDAVRIESIMFGNQIGVLANNTHETAAPMAHYGETISAGASITVALGAR